MALYKHLKVVEASPNDVQGERNSLKEVLEDFNKQFGSIFGVYLDLERYEDDAFPGFHKYGPQGLIDEILRIKDCDIFICIFWKKFGTLTKYGTTGTEHEFKQAYEAWQQNSEKPHIMMYFNEKEISVPRTLEDIEQLKSVALFKKNFPEEGLWWTYNGVDDFKIKVRAHIINYIKNKYNKSNFYNSVKEETTVLSNQEIENLLNNYTNSLEKKVSKIRLLGDNKEYDLTDVFVDLIINEEYERPSFSFQSLDEYKGMMDYELRKKRILLSDYYQKENDDENKEGKDKEKIIKKIKPEDLLKSDKKTTIIVGAPGSGKTTLMKYLVHKTLQDQEYFPIYLELKNIQKQNFNDTDRFEDIVFYEAIISPLGIDDKEEQESIHKKLKDKLKDGKIAFFLDGLDEMRTIDNDPHKISLLDLFNKFIRMDIIHNNLVIVTTRPYALKERFEQVQEMEIAPFNMEQIKQFINHYYSKDNLPDAKNFLNDLSTGTEIQELARVPLILGFLLQEYIEHKSFSEDKLDLYKNIVTRLNNKLDEVRGIKRNFKIENPIFRYEIITNLAFSGLFNFNEDILNRLVFTYKQILDKVKKYCYDNPEPKLNPYDLVEDIKATALLREIGNDKYSFTHLTIQEYLAATVLVKDKNNLAKLFCQGYFDPTICEMELLPITIGLSQSEVGNSKVNLYELLEKLPESLNYANFRIRVKGLGYFPRMRDKKYLSHITDRLIEFVTDKNIDDVGYKEIIFHVFSGLSSENTKYISQRLLELKKDDPNQILFYIKNLTYVLGILHDKDSISGLVDLLKDENPDVRRTAVVALTGYVLSGTQDRDVTIVLVAMLKDDDQGVRRTAVFALTGTQDKNVISGLVGLLKDENPDVRGAAADALRGTQDMDAISGLVAIMLKDENPDVRGAAAQALRDTQDKDVTSILVDLLKDENPDVRIDAAHALTGTQDKNVISGLVVLLKDENPYVGGAAGDAVRGYALSGTQDKDVTSILVAMLKDENSYVRGTAARALTGTQDKNVISGLVAIMLKDENPDVRIDAAHALTGTQDKNVISGLVVLLKDENPDVRRAAADALRGTQDKNVISGLVVLLKDENPDVRRAAADALRGTQDMDAISGLVVLLKDENSYVRGTAADALRGTQDMDAISGLVAIMLKDENSYVRSTAARALTGTQDKNVISGLVAIMLKDENPDVRGAAADALRGTQDMDAISGLVVLLKDEDWYVRGTAADALRGTQDMDAISGLVVLLKDEDPDIRRAAAYTLESYDHTILSNGLLTALSSDNTFVRKKSISVVGYYSNEEAERKLQEIIKNDQNEEIRNIAKIELEKLQFKIQILS